MGCSYCACCHSQNADDGDAGRLLQLHDNADDGVLFGVVDVWNGAKLDGGVEGGAICERTDADL